MEAGRVPVTGRNPDDGLRVEPGLKSAAGFRAAVVGRPAEDTAHRVQMIIMMVMKMAMMFV